MDGWRAAISCTLLSTLARETSAATRTSRPDPHRNTAHTRYTSDAPHTTLCCRTEGFQFEHGAGQLSYPKAPMPRILCSDCPTAHGHTHTVTHKATQTYRTDAPTQSTVSSCCECAAHIDGSGRIDD